MTPASPSALDLRTSVVLRLLEVLDANAVAFAGTRDVEPLHQLRVSARRVRAALAFFEPLHHGDAGLRRARRRIRALAVPFGELRDLDVFLELLDDGAAPVARADVSDLRTVLVRRRRELSDAVARVVGSKRWARTLRRVRHGVTAPAPPAVAVGAHRFAAERLDLWWWAFVAGSEGLAEMPPGRRHRVRIEAKRLRYATEATAGLFIDREEDRAAFTAGLTEVQDALGVLNDHATAERIVRSAGFDPVPLTNGAAGDDLARAQAARRGLLELGPYWDRRARPGRC